MEIPSFNALIQKSIVDHWDMDALTDYKGATLQYHDVARKIEKLHIMFENSGVVKGDKIALCGRNSANWAVAFLATLTYGAIAVPILHEFMPDQIHNIVNHSDAKLLFVGDVVATQIDATKMPGLEGIIYIPDYSLVVSRTDKLTYAREHLNEMFGIKYPKYFRKNHVNYYMEQNPDELAMINYTSGTTGFSKGVMVPYVHSGAMQILLRTYWVRRSSREILSSVSCRWPTCTAWRLNLSSNSSRAATSSISPASLVQPSSPRHSAASSQPSSLQFLWLSRRLSARRYSLRSRTTACVCCSTCL